MYFVRFISEEKESFQISMGMAGDAIVGCCKQNDPITTGNTYLITEYDKINLIQNMLSKSDTIKVEVLDTKKLRDSIEGFPQFRNDLLPLTKEDIKPTDEKSSFNILLMEGLGINSTDMTMRASAWRSLYRNIMTDDVSVRFSVSSSITFSGNAPILLSCGFSENILFGPIVLHRLMEFDFIINSPKLGSLDFSRKNSYEEQVSAFVDASWSVSKLDNVRFGADMDNEDLYIDSIVNMGVDAKKDTILINAISDTFMSMPAPESIIKLAQSVKSSYNANILVCGIKEDCGEGIININGRVKSLQMLNAIIKRADLVISCDGPAISMAAGGETPSVFLCSGTNASFISGVSEKTAALQVFEPENIQNLNKPTEEEMAKITSGWRELDIDLVQPLIKKVYK